MSAHGDSCLIPKIPSTGNMTKQVTVNQNETQLKLKLFGSSKSSSIRESSPKSYLSESEDEYEDDTLNGKTDNCTQTKSGNKKKGNRTMTSIIIPTHKPKKRKNELERDFPAICTVSVIGKSVEGRDIKMLKISNSDASNSAVWLDASIHSREWISTAVVTYIADVLAKNFQKLSPSIRNKDWHIVPVINPDGYEYSHTKDRMWRKNRGVYEGGTGVDLNRNFSCGWGNNGEQGSSEEPDNIFYRGPVPFSEPEAVAVRDAILGATTPFTVYLSFHSYFEMIIFPWGYKKDACPDYIKLLEGAAVMARAIYDTTGMTYKVGSTKDMTYYACGTSTDWCYGIAKIPFCYMVELRSRKYKFKLPKDMIMDTCVEIWNAVKNLMDYVDHVK
ncbi:carboxypeptidase B-like isoform X2 [Plodia interpunctella]|uniref:carboxypeptidase B-like isoform X2 n=1 Tax=Plodia interpunctella TaxID=58824 RepID=UPI002368EBEA|nr:carboxypeptidase B-like isoform X2 [Plodia interpunctella]